MNLKFVSGREVLGLRFRIYKICFNHCLVLKIYVTMLPRTKWNHYKFIVYSIGSKSLPLEKRQKYSLPCLDSYPPISALETHAAAAPGG